MEKPEQGRLKVFLSAGAIILASAAVFIASIQIAMGAEENKVVESPAATIESALPAETTQPSAEATPTESPIESQAPVEAADITEPAGMELPAKSAKVVMPSTEPKVTGEAVINDDPGPGLISGQEAVDAYTKVATELFGLDVDKSGLTVIYNGKEEYSYDNNGVAETRTTHENWFISSPDLSCGVDAATGTVISAERQSGKYPGGSITLEDFDGSNIGRDDPENAYIVAAREIVNAKLAQGRNIEMIQIDGVQFVWDDDNAGFDPGATGTALADCHVYMDTGLSYTLSFWGTDQLALYWFFSHPTHHACTWGYYYPEDGVNVPPESATGEWYTAPGVTDSTYSETGGRTPLPTASPSN